MLIGDKVVCSDYDNDTVVYIRDHLRGYVAVGLDEHSNKKFFIVLSGILTPYKEYCERIEYIESRGFKERKLRNDHN